MAVKILLADDDKVMRDGLRSLIEKQPEMEVVAEAENGRTAVRLNRKLRPDVIVMDIHMPEVNGIEATRRIVEEFPGAKVVAFSMHADRQFVVGAITAGVSGYLLKDCAFEELTHAIRTVAGSRNYLSSKIKDTLAEECSKTELPPRISRFCRLIGCEPSAWTYPPYH
jgi:DNA-binding NarL/FixJ family response regulator